MPKKKSGYRIEVFRSGTFKPMQGDPISYNADDLAGIARGYDPESAPAPVVVGHPSTDAPAYGWIDNFEYDADADRLYADLGEMDTAFVEAVQAGRYKKVSMSFHLPDAPNNPTPGKWYPKHIGFLGGAAPAVSGLKPAQFTASGEGEEVIFEAAFGEVGFEEAATLFRGLRDWIIEKFGREEADGVLPAWRIDWLDEVELNPKSTSTSAFAAPLAPETKEDIPMTPEEIEAEKQRLEEQRAAQDAREQELANKEASARSADHAAFAEKLVTEGKLLPANKDKFVAVLDALPADQAVSFSEGSSEPVAAALMALMEAQPQAVNFGTQDLGEDPGDLAEDASQLASFATAYQKEQADAGIHISISDAVAHVVKKGASK